MLFLIFDKSFRAGAFLIPDEHIISSREKSLIRAGLNPIVQNFKTY